MVSTEGKWFVNGESGLFISGLFSYRCVRGRQTVKPHVKENGMHRRVVLHGFFSARVNVGFTIKRSVTTTIYMKKKNS